MDAKEILQAYIDYQGNKTQAAESLGIPRSTFLDRLKKIEIEQGVIDIAQGNIELTQSRAEPLPKKGKIKRYILTSVQNNTHIHPAYYNLIALADYFKDCKLFVGTFSYQLSAYGKKSVKYGKHKIDIDTIWFDPKIKPYIMDERVYLAPDLVWCGEQNVIPTAKHPLSSFENYNGSDSNIVPHAKTSMTSVASITKGSPKFNYTTGTITQRNYIQKKIGILAEQHHSYGALLVEVNSDGLWWVRQLSIDDNGDIMDIADNGILVSKGKISKQNTVHSIYWGDIHSAELDEWVENMLWKSKGMLDSLRPKSQFLGDVFSMRSRSHHEMRNFHRMYEKYINGQDTVEQEIKDCADFLNRAERQWCETIIVPSNHDRHLIRWLNEADFRQDPINASYFCFLQYHLLREIKKGNSDFNILKFALQQAGVKESIRFLELDESCIVLSIENGLHGDLGANGARGSTTNYMKFGIAVNKGHAHTAEIRGDVYSCGVCSLDFPYTKGPSSHSVSHIITYNNGKRTIITTRPEGWKA